VIPEVTAARPSDLDAIHRTLRANRADPSLFQQPRADLAAGIDEFLVAREGPHVVGCIQVHSHGRGGVEILAVAVHPDRHGRGVGGLMMRAAIARAEALSPFVWLGTAKPAYFARHGFERMSRLRLPLRVLVGKLPKVARQPLRRWLPALFGRHVFMRRASA